MMQAPSPNRDAESIRRVTEEVLSRPEFNSDNLSLRELLEDTLRALLSQMGQYPELSRFILIGAIILLAAASGYLLYRLLKSALRRHPRPSLELGTAGAREIDRTALDVPEHTMDEARRRLARGDLYGAVRIAHGRLLELLDRRRIVRLAAGKTNRDYLQECSRQNPQWPLLLQSTRMYEQVVYARRQVTPGSLEELLNSLEASRISR